MIKSLLITAVLASTLSACAYDYPADKNLDDRPHADNYEGHDTRHGHYHNGVFYSDNLVHDHDRMDGDVVVRERTYRDGSYNETITTVDNPNYGSTKHYYYKEPMYNHVRKGDCTTYQASRGWCY